MLFLLYSNVKCKFPFKNASINIMIPQQNSVNKLTSTVGSPLFQNCYFAVNSRSNSRFYPSTPAPTPAPSPAFIWSRDELRTSGASPIFGRHRVALGCSGLHANCYFTAERNSPAPKNNNNNNNYYYYYDEIAPPYVTTTPFWL